MSSFICVKCKQEKDSYPRGRREDGWVCPNCMNLEFLEKYKYIYKGLEEEITKYTLEGDGDDSFNYIVWILDTLYKDVLLNRKEIDNFDSKLEHIYNTIKYTFEL